MEQSYKHLIELSAMMELFSVLSIMVTASYTWLLNI